MSYREMVRTCGIWENVRIGAEPSSDQLMERLNCAFELLKNGFTEYRVDLIDTEHHEVTSFYPDPRSALLEAVMMVEQGKKWNGKEWEEMK